MIAMYIPEDFDETNPERIATLIEHYPFGMLITAPAGLPFVSHLPLLLEKGTGTQGRLVGHMARANPQWQHLASGHEVLAVFQGPHAYVSPSWYSSPGVPTWNYAVAHLYGLPQLVEDEAELVTVLERLTAVHESRFPTPWQASLATEKQTGLAKKIVGFEIEITQIQGKFKLSQNRPPEDQRRVISRLGESNNPLAVELSALMTETRRGSV